MNKLENKIGETIFNNISIGFDRINDACIDGRIKTTKECVKICMEFTEGFNEWRNDNKFWKHEDERDGNLWYTPNEAYPAGYTSKMLIEEYIKTL